MLSINGKKFMNISEAVQWLLDNNALPFQSKANYVANTVIAKTTIVNPSPAEIKVGSLVLFADSKVGTVSGLTDAGFMVGQEYTDIGDQLNQITDIDLDASQHLIITLENGDTIDAGLVKQLSGFTIDASQHLIANYNDGTSTDLGAIFTGNVTISGSLTANTLEQTNANWVSPNIELNPSGDVASAGVDVTNIYNRFEVINNVLFIIVNISFHNPSASPVTISGNVRADKAISGVPANIGSKIIDFEGKSIAEVATTEHCLIAGTKAFTSRGLQYSHVEDSDWNVFLTNRTTANLCQLFIQKSTALTINAGATVYVSARLPLTLL